jgi:hypothetical protein
MTKTWKIRIVGLLLLGGLSYVVYPFVVGGTQMQSFCEAIQVGELEEKVLARVDNRGYTRRELEKGRLLIIDSGAMGRFICDISISDGKIVEATYVHNG